RSVVRLVVALSSEVRFQEDPLLEGGETPGTLVLHRERPLAHHHLIQQGETEKRHQDAEGKPATPDGTEPREFPQCQRIPLELPAAEDQRQTGQGHRRAESVADPATLFMTPVTGGELPRLAVERE